MRILRREEIWIHTHFVTDCVYLPDHHARDILRKMEQVLDEVGIVLGIHFGEDPRDRGLRIVLECLPLPDTLSKIESALAAAVEPVPARPRSTKVEIEPAVRPRGGKRR